MSAWGGAWGRRWGARWGAVSTAATLAEQIQTALLVVLPAGVQQGAYSASPTGPAYIVWHELFSVQQNYLSGAGMISTVRVQVDVIAKQAGGRRQYADAVVSAMTAGPWKSCIKVGERNVPEPQLRAYRRSIDFDIKVIRGRAV